MVGGVILFLFGALLGRLVFLYFYFGLFFYLLAALLCGAVVFQIMRPRRPLSRATIAAMTIVLSMVAWTGSVFWEYRFRAERIGEWPRFAAARAAMVNAERPFAIVADLAADAFRRRLRSDYAPGGMLGYIRWASAGGRMKLSLGDLDLGGELFEDDVSVPHRGVGWIIRAGVSAALLAAGLWWQLTSLRAASPVNNLIDPEEAEILNQEERREYGEPYHGTFEHTADIGIEARAKDWPGLLEQCARGLLSCIGYLVPDSADRGVSERIRLSADSREDLLHDWLSELLYRFEIEPRAIGRMTLHRADDHAIDAEIVFRRLDTKKTRFHREVKAVTYHGLEIKHERKSWTARVIVDI